MHITILGGPFLPMPPAPCGAVERVWHGLAEEFARRGHAVTVLCRAHPSQPADEVLHGVRYVRRTAFTSGRRLGLNLLKDLAYSLYMSRLLPVADILVTNAFWLPALAGVWGRGKGKLAVHVQRMPKGQLRLYDRACRLQAVSEAIRAGIVAQRPRLAGKVRVFPNPIDTRVFTPPPFRERKPTRTLLYTGRIHPEKGLELLLAAFARLRPDHPDLRLRVVGPWQVERGGGGDGYLQALRRLAGTNPVEFGEPIYDRPQLAELYRSADYYCYPSTAEQGEASPVAPVEAMATGLVPVVSALPQFRDTIRDGETGWVFDHRGADPAGELTAALRRAMADSAAAAEMRARAVRTAAQLSYERVAELYLADFAEMLRR